MESFIMTYLDTLVPIFLCRPKPHKENTILWSEEQVIKVFNGTSTVSHLSVKISIPHLKRTYLP